MCSSIYAHSPSYLVLYLWKEHCKQQEREIFEELLKMISMKQREEDSEHTLAKVEGCKNLGLIYLLHRLPANPGENMRSATTALTVARPSPTSQPCRCTSLCLINLTLHRTTSRSAAATSTSPASTAAKGSILREASMCTRGPAQFMYG